METVSEMIQADTFSPTSRSLLSRESAGMTRCGVILILGLLLGACGSSDGGPDDVPDAEPGLAGGVEGANVHTAFSGGGWRAHTAQAAWMMGMLDAGDMDLDALTQSVGSMASNSGGTWFLTQLAYIRGI